MTAARDRKEAAKRLGITLQMNYRDMLQAEGNDEIQTAAVLLGGTFNANIEFIIWVLKEFGGVVQMPIERQRAASVRPIAANDVLPVMPALLAAGRDVDLIGKD